MINNNMKNNLSLVFKSQRDYSRTENARYGSIEQRSTNYRRNGMLNGGAKQLIGYGPDSGVFTVGVGGPLIAG